MSYRITLIRCSNSAESKNHKHIWNTAPELRKGCVLPDNFRDGLKIFVCIILDNGLNFEPTVTDELFWKSNPKLGCSRVNVMLVPIRVYEDFIETEEEATRKLTNYDSTFYVLCAFPNCSQVVIQRHKAVLLGLKCSHCVCKHHFLPQTPHDVTVTNQIESEIKHHLRDCGPTEQLSRCRATLGYFMAGRTGLDNADIVQKVCSSNKFVCPICIQQGVTQFSGPYCTIEGLNEEIGKDLQSASCSSSDVMASTVFRAAQQASSSTVDHLTGPLRIGNKVEFFFRSEWRSGTIASINTLNSTCDVVCRDGRTIVISTTLVRHHASSEQTRKESRVHKSRTANTTSSSSSDERTRAPLIIAVGSRVELGRSGDWQRGLVLAADTDSGRYDIEMEDGQYLQGVPGRDLRVVPGDTSPVPNGSHVQSSPQKREKVKTTTGFKLDEVVYVKTKEGVVFATICSVHRDGTYDVQFVDNGQWWERVQADLLSAIVEEEVVHGAERREESVRSPAQFGSLKSQARSVDAGPLEPRLNGNVEIKYAKNGKWLSGKIVKANRGGTFDVCYDSKSSTDFDIPRDHIHVLDAQTGSGNSLFRVGATVEVLFEHEEVKWKPGRIVQVNQNKSFEVELADRRLVKMVPRTRVRVICSDEEVRRLTNDTVHSPSFSQRSAAPFSANSQRLNASRDSRPEYAPPSLATSSHRHHLVAPQSPLNGLSDSLSSTDICASPPRSQHASSSSSESSKPMTDTTRQNATVYSASSEFATPNISRDELVAKGSNLKLLSNEALSRVEGLVAHLRNNHIYREEDMRAVLRDLSVDALLGLTADTLRKLTKARLEALDSQDSQGTNARIPCEEMVEALKNESREMQEALKYLREEKQTELLALRSELVRQKHCTLQEINAMYVKAPMAELMFARREKIIEMVEKSRLNATVDAWTNQYYLNNSESSTHVPSSDPKSAKSSVLDDLSVFAKSRLLRIQRELVTYDGCSPDEVEAVFAAQTREQLEDILELNAELIRELVQVNRLSMDEHSKSSRPSRDDAMDVVTALSPSKSTAIDILNVNKSAWAEQSQEHSHGGSHESKANDPQGDVQPSWSSKTEDAIQRSSFYDRASTASKSKLDGYASRLVAFYRCNPKEVDAALHSLSFDEVHDSTFDSFHDIILQRRKTSQTSQEVLKQSTKTSRGSEFSELSAYDCADTSTKFFVDSLVDRLEKEYRYERDEILAAVHVLSDQELKDLSIFELRTSVLARRDDSFVPKAPLLSIDPTHYLGDSKVDEASPGVSPSPKRLKTSSFDASPSRFVNVFCPELNKSIKFDVLRLRVNFRSVKRAVCEAVGYSSILRTELILSSHASSSEHNVSDGLSLLKLDEDGWCVEVSDNYGAESEESVHYSSLREGDSLEVRRFGVAFVGGRFRLSVIAASERFNAALGDKVAALARDYTGFRRIRGDGNCYYRAVIYGLIEFIVRSGRREMFTRIIECFKGVTYLSDEMSWKHGKMVRYMEDARNNFRWSTMAEFDADLLRESSGLDEALIRACKKVVTDVLIRGQETVYNDMSVRDAILVTYEDVLTVEEFCSKYVLAMEVCAEGIHVNLGLLPSALGCDCNIVILPRERDSRIATIESRCAPLGGEERCEVSKSSNGGSGLFTLNLLLRPGHYDLLYTEDQSGFVPLRELEVVKPMAEVTGESREVVAPATDNFSSSTSSLVAAPKITEKAGRSSPNPFSQFGLDEDFKGSQSKAAEFDAHSYLDSQKIATPSRRAPEAPLKSDPSLFKTISLVDVSSDDEEEDEGLKDPSISPAEQLVSILSVSHHVAQRLLDRYPDVEDAVTAYFGLSDERKEALEAKSQTEPAVTDSSFPPQSPGRPSRNNSSQMDEVLRHSVPVAVNPIHAAVRARTLSATESSQNESQPQPQQTQSQGENEMDFDAPVGAEEVDRVRRRADNEALLAMYQGDDPLLRLPHKVELVWRLVDDLGFDMNRVVVLLNETRVVSVFGFLYIHRYSELGLDYAEVPNEVLRHGNDEEMVAIIHTLVNELQYDRLEVYDAIVFDWCRIMEDVFEVLSISLERDAPPEGSPTVTKTYAFSQAPFEKGEIEVLRMVKKFSLSRHDNAEVNLPSAQSVLKIGRKALIALMKRHSVFFSNQMTYCTVELRHRFVEYLEQFRVVA